MILFKRSPKEALILFILAIVVINQMMAQLLLLSKHGAVMLIITSTFFICGLMALIALLVMLKIVFRGMSRQNQSSPAETNTPKGQAKE